MDSLGNIWKHIYSGPRNGSTLWLLIIVRYTNTLTYLLCHAPDELLLVAWYIHSPELLSAWSKVAF